MNPVIKTNIQIFNEPWYILDSRKYMLGEFILPNLKVGEENPKEDLSVWKIKEVPLYEHLNVHNSRVYEVSIEEPEDIVRAIDEVEEERTSEIGHLQYWNVLLQPLKVYEIINLISGTTSNSQEQEKEVPSLAYCLVKKVKVIREILSVFYVVVKNNFNVGDSVLPEDCLHRHPYHSLTELKSSLKNEHFDGKIFKVYRGAFIKNAIEEKGLSAEVPLGEYITDTETLKKWDLSNEVQLFL